MTADPEQPREGLREPATTAGPDQPRELRIAPEGDLDLAAGRILEGEIRQRKSPSTERVVVDLRGVGFLDSTGLRVLISLRNDAKRGGHDLTLVAGPPTVQRVFQLTATRGLFNWLDGSQEAEPSSQDDA
jgi:anti-anti-sigma factor